MQRPGLDAADDRDEVVIDQIYSAGLLLRSAAPLLENADAARHVDRAIAELDLAMAVVRRGALAPPGDAPCS
jgi:hypothetical protein